MQFPVHTLDSAPEGARTILDGAQKQWGFVPNLLAMFATAPALLETYTTVMGLLARSSLSATEQQIVLLATSFENDCDYCMAAHTTISGMLKVPSDVVTSLRAGEPIADPKLEALHVFSTTMVERRGWASEADLEAFYAAGYGQQQALEVVLGIGLKTMSNYANHIAKTPLDEAFQPAAWAKPEVAAPAQSQ